MPVRIAFLSLSLMTAFVLSAIFAAPSFAQNGFTTTAKQAILIDDATGMVLFEKNADEKMPTSSMSKVMTIYMVFDAIKDGRLSMDDTLLVSEKAWRKGGSKMFVEVDKRVKVADLVRGVIIQSGNDATIVLAEGITGTEDEFARAMSAKAKNLGMRNSNFKNASGWPDPDHYSTARDLAALGRAIYHDFPQFYKIYSETEFEYSNIKQQNRNPLLYQDIGADGIKTGHTEAGGYGLIGSGAMNGRRVFMVVNGLSSVKERASEAGKILNYGLRSFQNERLFKAGQSVAQADVKLGQSAHVDMVMDEDVLVSVLSMNANEVRARAVYDGPLIAPLQKGQQIGVLQVKIPGREELLKYPLKAGADIPEQGFVSKGFTKLKMMISGNS